MTLAAKIVSHYGPAALNKSVLSIRDGGGVFERVLGGRQYKRVLEIGTYRGVSAAEMSQYCDRVTTIDLVHGKLERMGETWDRHAFWSTLGRENIDLILVENDRQKARAINSLQFDFAFIDGAHDDPDVIRSDFELVRRCGAVLFHDVDRRGKREQDYVIDFVESLPAHQVQKLDIFAIWTDS